MIINQGANTRLEDIAAVQSGLEAVENVRGKMQAFEEQKRKLQAQGLKTANADSRDLYYLILMDFSMPVMKGDEAAKAITLLCDELHIK